MELLQQAVLALLSAVGIVSLCWEFGGRALSGGREPIEHCTALVSAAGEAPGLERTVRALLHTAVGGRRFQKILIADCGLSKEARTLAELLSAEHAAVVLCSMDEAEGQLRQTKEKKTKF